MVFLLFSSVYIELIFTSESDILLAPTTPLSDILTARQTGGSFKTVPSICPHLESHASSSPRLDHRLSTTTQSSSRLNPPNFFPPMLSSPFYHNFSMRKLIGLISQSTSFVLLLSILFGLLILIIGLGPLSSIFRKTERISRILLIRT